MNTLSVKANINTTNTPLSNTFFSKSKKTKVSKTAFVERLARRSFSMDVTYNKDVKKFVKKYISKDRTGTELLLGRQTTFLPIFEKYIEEFQLPRELKNLPIQFSHQPFLMTPLEQQLYNFKLGKDYPLPIVDVNTQRKHASDILWGMRNDKEVLIESKRILKRHTLSDRNRMLRGE